MPTKYHINKGVNRSLEFKGVKAQYIIYLCLGFIVLLLLFVTLYLIGINTYVCLVVIAAMGVAFYLLIQYYSKKYGEHGLARQAARKQLPKTIVARSRDCFTLLRNVGNEKREKNRRGPSRLESGE